MGEMNENKTGQKRRKSYKKAYEKAAAECQVLQDRLLRLAAEFDNYKKRIEREREIFVKQSNQDLVSSLLPVLDDLDRTIAAGEESDNDPALLDGIKMIQKNFLKILSDQGLEPIDSLGKEFDPEIHDALMQRKADGKPPNIIIEELTKGYSFKDRLIRAAKVVIST